MSDIAKVVGPRCEPLIPTIKNVVILGDDSQIPMARVPDATTLSNETSFAQDFIGPENELTASLAGGYVLTDAPYVNPTPLGVGSGSLFVPEIAIGRLVSTPAEIEASLTAFNTHHGILSDGTGLSTGYDFLGPGAQAVAANLGLVPARQITQLVSNADCTTQPPTVTGPTPGSTWPAADCWTADNLATGLLNNPNLVGLNAHFDYSRLLPANGNQTGNRNHRPVPDLQPARPAYRPIPACSMAACSSPWVPTPDSRCRRTSSECRSTPGSNTFADEGALWVASTRIPAARDATRPFACAGTDCDGGNFARYLDEHARRSGTPLSLRQAAVTSASLADLISPYDVEGRKSESALLPGSRCTARGTPRPRRTSPPPGRPDHRHRPR